MGCGGNNQHIPVTPLNLREWGGAPYDLLLSRGEIGQEGASVVSCPLTGVDSTQLNILSLIVGEWSQGSPPPDLG